MRRAERLALVAWSMAVKPCPRFDAVSEPLEGARSVAPSLLDDELANICLVKSRREPDQREALRTAYGMTHRLRIETLAVDSLGVLDLAEKTGLTAYDARYLLLARALGADLVTLDRKLQAASV